MALIKHGSEESIIEATSDPEKFSKIFKNIDSKNNVKRCEKCGTLLAKRDGEAYTLQKSGMRVVASGDASVECPKCHCVNRI
jgi:phage FluMu protein Com